jgi:hypothetical protein
MTRTEQEAHDKLLRDAKAETEKYTLQDDDALKKALVGEDWAHGHWKTQPGPAIEIDPDLDPTVTLYLREDTHTVNGLEAYQLGTTQTSTTRAFSRVRSGEHSGQYRFQILTRASGGSETTIGDWIAETTRTPPLGQPGMGIQDASWECPYTALVSTDAVKVTYRLRVSSDSFVSDRSFITSQLGAAALSNETWVIYRYSYIDYDWENTTLFGYHGSSSYDSRITNFSYLEGGKPRSWGVILG